MSRFLSVFLPHLPLERLKQERAASGAAPLVDDRPLALVGNEEHGLVLTAVNAASVSQGLFPGLGLADARAICPHLLTLPAAPNKDEEALRDLARWASCRYSPTLNSDGGDGLWLEVSGVPHLFGGEQALLADLARRLSRLGFTARLALAETLGGAHALARYARAPVIVPAGEIGPALAPLPVEALRLEPEITSLLRRLGLKRIGQLYQLPRASLERRFHARETTEAVLLRLGGESGASEHGGEIDPVERRGDPSRLRRASLFDRMAEDQAAGITGSRLLGRRDLELAGEPPDEDLRGRTDVRLVDDLRRPLRR